MQLQIRADFIRLIKNNFEKNRIYKAGYIKNTLPFLYENQN